MFAFTQSTLKALILLIILLSFWSFMHSSAKCCKIQKSSCPAYEAFSFTAVGGLVFVLQQPWGLAWSCVCFFSTLTAFRQNACFLTTVWEHCFDQHNSGRYSSGNQTIYFICLIFNATLKKLSTQKNHHHLLSTLGGALTKSERTPFSLPLSILVILPIKEK